ncbi:hypothetical protein E6C50_08445 [Flavobacterium supellecticarium]|uniref:Uncharacterized protein n=1 Tax=Flavobacterium supellecticarium TaxID=2565924 RepID=A0A4S4A0J5_9FLAO|nr:hypothetical protein [Flavobacterium supellecticarium]THF51775.1 hypothetical protein E6C50_08445 [Flavobacterium supellecticarium]
MSENTKIVQCFLPAMVAGKYTTVVHQQVIKDKSSLQDLNKTFDFGVDAARFTLNPNDIYSVYPPANQSGNYSESLPHLVFTRRTLPWERTLDGKLPVFQRDTTPENLRNPQDSPPVPWMALLLFDEEEMKGLPITKNTIAGVIQPNLSDGIIRPDIFEAKSTDKGTLKLMEWEKTTDGCFTIDLTKEQFENYIPSQKSLSLLAHAKEVRIDNKDKDGITDINADGAGVFAVIVGNRLPAKGKQHTAILVSLEGYTDYLKDADPKKNIPDDHKVRLVVLASWNFIDSGKASFSQLVDGLELKSIKIQRGVEAPELTTYFDSGYVPLEHLTRTGANTISWYHGPLVPKLFPTTSKGISFSSADAALRYDKTTGFFDISFAAAWQLGRILALQNQEFSKAILNWRLAQNQLEAEKSKNNTLNAILEDDSAINIKDKVIRYLGDLHAVTTVVPEETTTDLPTTVPNEVKHFLGNLYKLNGIPFSYIVPHEWLLQKEHLKNNKNYTGTLSLFYVDPNWIEALLDGALSIGRTNKNEALLEQAVNGNFIDGYQTQSMEISGGTIEKKGRRLNTTGFLLRSDLVSGWRGLEITAFDADNQLLPALRFERIDSDIFLGIFDGNIASISIKQPYEGLHFGIKNNNAYIKNLKNEDGTNQEIADGTADVNAELNDGLIKNNVIDIAGLARVMQEKLTAKNWMEITDESKGIHFTSAEFAYQMVDSPVKKNIAINILNTDSHV